MSAPAGNATVYVAALLRVQPSFENFLHTIYKRSTLVELYILTAIWLVGVAAYVATLICSLCKSRAAGEKIFLYRFLDRPEGRYLSLNALYVASVS